MAKIYNSDVTKGLAKNAGIQQSREKTPDELAEKIVPVMETNPELLRKTTFVENYARSATDATVRTIKSSNPNKKTYLTGAMISLVKDAACNATASLSITVTLGGATKTIISIRTLTLTAERADLYINFPPLEIDPGTDVNLSAFSYAAGNASNIGIIYGYEVDNAHA